MPRRSIADLEIVPPDDRPTPLQPPADLGKTERAIWLSIVNACQPKHFRASDEPLLVRYTQAVALGRQAVEGVGQGRGVRSTGKPNPWLKVGELVDKTLVALDGGPADLAHRPGCGVRTPHRKAHLRPRGPQTGPSTVPDLHP